MLQNFLFILILLSSTFSQASLKSKPWKFFFSPEKIAKNIRPLSRTKVIYRPEGKESFGETYMGTFGSNSSQEKIVAHPISQHQWLIPCKENGYKIISSSTPIGGPFLSLSKNHGVLNHLTKLSLYYKDQDEKYYPITLFINDDLEFRTNVILTNTLSGTPLFNKDGEILAIINQPIKTAHHGNAISQKYGITILMHNEYGKDSLRSIMIDVQGQQFSHYDMVTNLQEEIL